MLAPRLRATWEEERRRVLLLEGKEQRQPSGAKSNDIFFHAKQRITCLLSSLESSDCGRSPLLLALITDGNATDDSGIDSICCDSAVSPSGGSIDFLFC